MASSNVDLVKMADSAVARGDSNVFELHVHVVLGYTSIRDGIINCAGVEKWEVKLRHV